MRYAAAFLQYPRNDFTRLLPLLSRESGMSEPEFQLGKKVVGEEKTPRTGGVCYYRDQAIAWSASTAARIARRFSAAP